MEDHRHDRCRRPARELSEGANMDGRWLPWAWRARGSLLFTIGLLLCLAAAPASAHFLLNLNVRILHVEHLSDGFRVYLRTPMPYLVADRIGPVAADGLPDEHGA